MSRSHTLSLISAWQQSHLRELVSFYGQDDNNLYLYITANEVADKDYTVSYFETVDITSAYIPGNTTDKITGNSGCSGKTHIRGTCTLNKGNRSTRCLMYEAPCQTLTWEGTLTKS